jgi:hypothetical protein
MVSLRLTPLHLWQRRSSYAVALRLTASNGPACLFTAYSFRARGFTHWSPPVIVL